MEQGTTDPTPDLDDLYQEETDAVSVPVRGEGPFLVQQLPARRVQYATDLIPVGSWVPLLPETPKRARSVLVADGPFYVSSTATGAGMLWPAGVPLEVRSTQRVYVMGGSPAAGMDSCPLNAPEMVTVPNPGAGVAPAVVEVPAGETWEVMSVRCFLATSAVAGNRTPEVTFRSPAGIDFVCVSASVGLGPTASRSYNWWQGGSGAVGNGNLGMGLPLGYRLPAGSQIRLTVFALDVADAISAISLAVRKSSSSAPVNVSHFTELWAD